VLGGVIYTGNVPKGAVVVCARRFIRTSRKNARTADFGDSSYDPESGRTHNFGIVQVWDTPSDANGLPILPALPDVGMPPQFPVTTISGWDMRSIYWQYDDM
jgi:hypothetical protein